MELALDNETTGLDLFHGCKSFLVTGCDGQYNYFWQGHVDPNTREVTWEDSVLDDLTSTIKSASRIIFHNTQFDLRCLELMGIDTDLIWPKYEDTLLLSHILCSSDKSPGKKNTGKSGLGLKDLAIKYLRFYADDEQELNSKIVSLRQSNPSHPGLARYGHPHFPAASKNSTWWKQDMWLDMSTCLEYAIRDAQRTYLLWKVFEVPLYAPPCHFNFRYQQSTLFPADTDNNLLNQYNFRKNLLPVLYETQSTGLYTYTNKIDRLVKHLEFQLEGLINLIKEAANWPGYFNPESPVHLRELLFSKLKLEPFKLTDTGLSSTDKETLTALFEEHNIPALNYLRDYSITATELGYIKSYKLWTLDNRIHGNINATGTKWTRNSASDPNLQNLKKEVDFLFGPDEEHYWLYFDVVNIELRIWAYDTNNRTLIEAFERGESVHMIIARTIRPHQIERAGNESLWKATDPIHKQYTKTKGGTFSWIYGGSPKKVNKTYGIEGAVDKIRATLPGVAEYFDALRIQMNYLTTLYAYPTIHTIQGYPLQVPVSKPYTVSSGRIQGTAGLIVQDMMVQLPQHPVFKERSCKFVQQVHDSLKIEIPIHAHYETTNSILVAEAERIGSLHIPTCPLEAETIFCSRNESFRLKVPTISYPPVHEYTVTHYYQDGIGWIASGKHKDDIIETTGPSPENAYNELICKIEGTPF